MAGKKKLGEAKGREEGEIGRVQEREEEKRERRN